MRFQCTFCFTIIRDDGEQPRVSCPNCHKHVAVPKTPFETGCVIDDFVIQNVIGYGGMATVYLVRQLSMDRPVALKVLSDEYYQRDNFRQSFLREAKAAARLNHPNLIQAMKVGEEDGKLFYAMEYVEGQTVADKIETEKSMDIDISLNITQQCAEALHTAWSQEGLIHRDIKPDNIMLAEDGYAKIMDLGIAIRVDQAEKVDISGTPTYMAPEQFRRERLDCRTDLYSLGATLYHMLVGFPPFDGETVQDIARSHIFQPLDFPESNLVYLPQRIKRLISKMMAKDPAERYQDYEELLGDIVAIRKRLAPDEDQVPSVHTISFSKYRLHEKMAESPSEIYRRRSDRKRKVAIAKEQRTQKDRGMKLGPWILISMLLAVIVLLSLGVVVMQQGKKSAFVNQVDSYLMERGETALQLSDLNAIEQAISEVEAVLAACPEDPTAGERQARADLRAHRELLREKRISVRQKMIDLQRDQFEKDFSEYRDALDQLGRDRQKLEQEKSELEERLKDADNSNKGMAALRQKLKAAERRAKKLESDLTALRQELANTQIKASLDLRYSLEWRLINLCRDYEFEAAMKAVSEALEREPWLKEWGARKQKQLLNATRIYRLVHDSGTKLKGQTVGLGQILAIDQTTARISVTEDDIVTIEEVDIAKFKPVEFVKLAESRWQQDIPYAMASYDFLLSTGDFVTLRQRKLPGPAADQLRQHVEGCFRQVTDTILAHLRSGNRKYASSLYRVVKGRYGDMREFRQYDAELSEAFRQASKTTTP